MIFPVRLGFLPVAGRRRLRPFGRCRLRRSPGMTGAGFPVRHIRPARFVMPQVKILPTLAHAGFFAGGEVLLHKAVAGHFLDSFAGSPVFIIPQFRLSPPTI